MALAVFGGHQCTARFSPAKVLPKVVVWLLDALELVKRQGWWNEKFAVFPRPASCGGGQTLVQRLTPPDP